jgi:hypothetical protein
VPKIPSSSIGTLRINTVHEVMHSSEDGSEILATQTRLGNVEGALNVYSTKTVNWMFASILDTAG